MKITICAHDIIERCLFDDFQYYVLDKDVDVEEFITKNEEFEIGEKDALVMGLLKCIETNNLNHRLNQYIQHFLSNRAFTYGGKYYLKKNLLIDTILRFKKKFPDEWKPSTMYKDALSDVLLYVDELIEAVEGLKITEYSDTFGNYELVDLNHVKKILKHHN